VVGTPLHVLTFLCWDHCCHFPAARLPTRSYYSGPSL